MIDSVWVRIGKECDDEVERRVAQSSQARNRVCRKHFEATWASNIGTARSTVVCDQRWHAEIPPSVPSRITGRDESVADPC